MSEKLAQLKQKGRGGGGSGEKNLIASFADGTTATQTVSMASYGNIDVNNIFIEPKSYNNNAFITPNYGYVRVQYTQPSVSYNSSTQILTINSPKLQVWGSSSSGSYGTTKVVYLGYDVYLA